jgi:hypothetical protein
MAKFSLNPNPKDLAEMMAALGSRCPIPATHDRLFEVHHWWHEMAHWYHEPEPFRYRLGAFIHAARSVTFMLQKERGVFKDFHWYAEWVSRSKGDPVLIWLKNIRTGIVHTQALEPSSWLQMRCIGNARLTRRRDGHPLQMKVSPFRCTHYYMHGPGTDHRHEFTRHWSMEGLDGRELLEVCADVYDRLDGIVQEAHERAGAKMVSHARPDSARKLPCMEEIKKYRVTKTHMRRGKEVWLDEPKGPRHH